MPEVLILGVVGLTVYLKRNVVRLGVLYLLLTGFDVPNPPGGDYLHLGGERLYRKLKPYLIVALAGAAVADSVGALGLGYLDELLCDYRAGEGGAEQIFLLINRACLNGGEDVVADEFILEVGNIEL